MKYSSVICLIWSFSTRFDNSSDTLPEEVGEPHLEGAAVNRFGTLPRIDIPTSSNNVASSETQKVKTVVSHEGNILKDLMDNFKDAEIVNDYLIIKRGLPQRTVNLEAGYWNGKRCSSEFWKELCTTGFTFKIPITRHNMKEEEWKSVGRIPLK